MKFKMTREQIEACYEDLLRRIDGYWTEDDIKCALQGLYAAFMPITSNWSDVVFWMCQIEEENGILSH